MKLKEFLENINVMVTDNPDILNLEVVSSADDEGNSFDTVDFSPSIGVYEDREFHSQTTEDLTENADESDDDDDDDDDEYQTPNAICIN